MNFKKIRSILITVLIFSLCFGTAFSGAYAETESKAYDGSYKEQLTTVQKQYYEELENAFIENGRVKKVKNTSITVIPKKDITIPLKWKNSTTATYGDNATEIINNLYTDIEYAYVAFIHDYPQLFWAGGIEYSIKMNGFYSGDKSTTVASVVLTVDEAYKGAIEKIGSYKSGVDAAVKSISGKVGKNKDTYNISKEIHDYLCDKLTYNYDAVNKSKGHEKAHCSGPVFTEKKPKVVCEGYAEAFKVLCDEFNIPCVLIAGDANGESHLWNYVSISEKWYAVDVTWDDLDKAKDGIRYTYFMVGSDKIKDHTVNNTAFSNNKAISFKYPVLSSTSYSVPSNDPLKAPTISISNNTSTGKNIVSWKSVSGASKYSIYRSTSKTGKYTCLKTVTGTSYTDTTASAEKTYYYKVKAQTSKGKTSAYSNIVLRTCDLAKPVITASNVAPTGKVKLSWKKIAGADKYYVYRANSKNGTYDYIGFTKGTSYTDAKAVAEKTYYYKVRAMSTTNTGAHSAYSSVVNRACDLARPEITVSTVNKGKIKLTWKKVSGADKYYVYRATSKNGTYKYLSSTTGASLTNTSVKKGQTYYYKVRAISTTNSSANSSYSSIKGGTVK